MPTLDEYRALMDDRPDKFSAQSVHYRESDGRERCSRCQHFYERKVDHLGMCEIMRSDDTDEEGVQPHHVCDFYTQDGENFPLLD